MVKYYFKGTTFVVEDFQKAKRFCSFFPAIAGVDGKPLWAFYANVGQCMGGFGVGSKDTPITPFDSATLAYQNIPLRSFRTFLRVDSKNYSPFFTNDSSKRVMEINKTSITITEENDGYLLTVTYSTVSHKDYPALIRQVTIKNLDNKPHKYDICDGLPVFFPHGLSNVTYKELVSLMEPIQVLDRRRFCKLTVLTSITIRACKHQVPNTIQVNVRHHRLQRMRIEMIHITSVCIVV